MIAETALQQEAAYAKLSEEVRMPCPVYQHEQHLITQLASHHDYLPSQCPTAPLFCCVLVFMAAAAVQLLQLFVGVAPQLVHRVAKSCIVAL